ncbi:glycine zipper 2TM domain-containing protein [Sandarakinorhabdus sp.]|uniref:glycine zipper 2TM domain-containing protein n=1 Tax=Sandarakinorhabdus sp. TaxID=1916663 RepID=UPI00286E5394|nr:glycine zipper 2TM domain-containing protein [Sandarakinorhabdus sp.]
MKTIISAMLLMTMAAPVAAQEWQGGGPLFQMYQQHAQSAPQAQAYAPQAYSRYGDQGFPPAYEQSGWGQQGQYGQNGPPPGYYDQRGNNDQRGYRDERRCSGGTGAVVGGLAGGAVGYGLGGRRNRTAGTIFGAIAGAVAGNAIERSSCRNRNDNRGW